MKSNDIAHLGTSSHTEASKQRETKKSSPSKGKGLMKLSNIVAFSLEAFHTLKKA